VESVRPGWLDGEGWQVGSEPLVSIGVAEGDSTQHLFSVRDAVRLADGTIVIVDRGTNHVRWYDASGSYLRSAGRSGAGPGEFSDLGPGSICVLSDERLLVSDPIQARANVFASDGSFVEIIQAPPVGAAFPSIQGCFDDGALQLWHAEQGPDRIPDTIIGAEFVWTRFGADGVAPNELTRIPVRTQYLLSDGAGGGSYHTIPFMVRPASAVGGERFHLTTGADPEITVRRADGRIEAVWRWAAERIRSSDVLARYETHMIDAQTRPDRRAQTARFFRVGLDVPEYIASTVRLLAAEDGHLWAERYRLPWDTVPTWDVFAPEGVWLGGVNMPAGFSVYRIYDDAVLGRGTDEDGVEQVVLYALRR
jgi:hypothetical protein